jgi:hypothetical protein
MAFGSITGGRLERIGTIGCSAMRQRLERFGTVFGAD